VAPPVKEESHVAMETDPPKSTQSAFSISPVAVALNKWFEQNQKPGVASVVPTLLIQQATPAEQTISPPTLTQPVAVSQQSLTAGIHASGVTAQTGVTSIPLLVKDEPVVQAPTLNIQAPTLNIQAPTLNKDQTVLNSMAIQQLLQQQITVSNNTQMSARPLSISQILQSQANLGAPAQSTMPAVAEVQIPKTVSQMESAEHILQLAPNNTMVTQQLPQQPLPQQQAAGNTTLMELSRTDNAATTAALLQLVQAQLPGVAQVAQVVNNNTVTLNNAGQMANPIEMGNLGTITINRQPITSTGNLGNQSATVSSNMSVSQLLQQQQNATNTNCSGSGLSLYPVETLLNSPGISQPK